MKRAFALVFLPVVLFALEPVNLIKDAGFEKDSELWLMRSETEGAYDSTIINRHDPDSAYIGDYCGSIDGRKKPAPNLPELYDVVGYLYQIIIYPKKLENLDSLEFFHMVFFHNPGIKSSTWNYGVSLYFVRPSDGALIEVLYFWLPPSATPAPDNAFFKGFPDTMPDEGIWLSFKCNLKTDLIEKKGLSENLELDTFLLSEPSVNHNGYWYSQKAFFDGIRLTGYADYDVGVKGILSGDSLREGTYYTPIARIKNFGRENAEFSVIAEIWEAETRVYYDSLPWSLTSDTEDTVTFAAFTPTSATNHTLIVRTSMTPDESDEDDELSKPLFGTGISEPVTHLDAITLDVCSLASPLHVSYTLPYAESGTLTIYDASGRRIERMAVKGTGKVEFEAALPSGIYIVRLETGNTTLTMKADVLK